FTVDGNDYTDKATISLNNGVEKAIVINVTPDATAAVATFTLSMKSLTNLTAPERLQKVYVIAGVTDLILNNSSAWGDGGETRAKDFEGPIKDGLNYAGNSTFASTESEVIDMISSSDILSDVKNIYYNVGWSFPSLNDELVAFFADFLDQGGNLFVSGQDIGWDNFETSGYGTPVTAAFVTNYLHAGYIIDGDHSHSQLTASSTDGIFNAVNSSSLVNKYGKNPDTGVDYFYPDQLSVGINGQSVFYYNGNTSKTAVIRSRMDDYKTLFMGVSLEMIADADVQKEIMKLTYDWFTGVLSTEEFDKGMLELSGNYPNPAGHYTVIPVYGNDHGLIQISDLNGKIISQHEYAKGITEVQIPTMDLAEGLYLYKIFERNENRKSLLFMVKH
nr:T9SS type A sorting domain-containing protein [Bacteroidota bacterium]